MKTLSKMVAAVALAAAMTSNSYALLITAGTTPSMATGPETSQSAINAVINPLMAAGTTELWKSDAGGGSYSYSQNTVPGLIDDDFTITYTGGATPTGSIYLLVKDGNHSPAWYLYEITGWNGTETIQGQNFWPDGGGISHVTIYGGGTSNGVPDGGSTLLLLGAAFGTLGWFSRRMRA